MRNRPYRNENDIALLQDFNSRSIKANGGCGFLHPGDIPHHFFSGNKTMDPAKLCTIWEDGDGVSAWILAEPKYCGFDAQVRPDLRGGEFEREVLERAELKTMELMDAYNIESENIFAVACQCDVNRSRALSDLGWSLDVKAEYVLNRRPLREIPEPELPHGYTIRTASGVEEAEDIANLHMAVFKSKWTKEQYKAYMENPGYKPEREYLAVDPQGNLAAFTVTWLDELNRTVLFEPVGTHPDHRKKGLARALMNRVMRNLMDKGYDTALVQNEGANEASKNLYLGMGFEPWQKEDGYLKKIERSQ